MSDQLIITAGNNSFFEYLKKFVYSLRTHGEYKGKIVICDNTIKGSWDNPGTYQEVASFSDKQVEFFDSFDVSVVLFHELLSRHGITREDVNMSRGYTTRYPYKFIYNCLIANEHLKMVDWICYFDADVYVQSPIQRIFDRLASGKLAMSPERRNISQTSFMETWIEKTDLSFGTSQESFLEEMGSTLNYCTGFFGSDVATFNRTMLLCWMMSTNQLADFYSDQPMVNIMCSFFSLPTKDVGRDATLHLGDISQERIRFEEGKLIFEDIAPSVIHFNGRKGQFYQNVIDKIRDQSGSTYYVDSYLKRNIFIPAKRKVRYIKKSWMMKYIRKLYNAITGAI